MSELSSDHWQRVERCFTVASEMDAQARRRYLEALATDDPAVFVEVKALLDVHDGAGSFLEDSALAYMTDLAWHPGRPSGDENDPMIGRVLGRYRIVRIIARGGMGAVYLAERADDEFEQQVALKLIRSAPGCTGRADDLLDRFHTERQVLANLSHPNIASLIDGGSVAAPGLPERLPYLVMEYVDGERIDDYCDGRRLTIEQRIERFRTVCEAVQHAHRNLVIHRDLKPSNILVTADGVVKLLDFGIARMLHPEAQAADLVDATLTAQRRLTPSYASPEQILGRPSTTATDVYSLGVVLYELLTGRRPYRLSRDTNAELEEHICNRPPTRPGAAIAERRRGGASPNADPGDEPVTDRRSLTTAQIAALRRTDPARLGRQLRGDLETILLTALAKEPERRYASAGQLADDLGRYLRREPIAARPPSAGYLLRKFVQRNSLLSGAVAAMILGLMVAVVGTSVGLMQARAATAEAERQSRIALAVNTFLNEDLLMLANPNHNPDREMTVEEALDLASERIEDRAGAFAEEPLVEAGIRETLAGAYFTLGAYERSLHHWNAALEILQPHLGDDDAVVLRARSSAAFAEAGLGRPEQAIDRVRNVLERQAALLGEDHPDTLQTMLRLAWSLVSAGEYGEAESLYLRLLDHAERVLGPDHHDTLSAIGQLGDIRRHQRRYDEAEALLARSLEGHRRTVGDEHPSAIMARSQLGLILLAQGRHEQAQALLVSAMDTSRRVLGDQHDQTAVVIKAVAQCYLAQGRALDAEPLLVEVLEIVRAVDPDHPQALGALHNLATLYRDLDRLDEALPLYAEAAEIAQRVYPEGHMHVGVYLSSWAEVLLDAGRAEEAQPILRRAHAIYRERLGDDHALTRRAMANLERSADGPLPSE